MNKLLLIFTFSLFLLNSFGQTVNPEKITIARDSFGVPHIFAETDAEVAYGLAWAQCEDQFRTMQELMAACKGMLGELKGKDGVIADIGIQFMGIAEFVKANYESEVTGEFRNYLEHFVAGVNAYAAAHPDRVLLKKLFPVTGEDVITGYLLGNVEISGAGADLQKIMSGSIKRGVADNFPKGSNAFAISRSKTTDGKTFLAINSHQPLEGWYSWYEAHLMSQEGLNIIGGTFAGGICIFLGANENLGWAHTVNHGDFSDVYKLTVNITEDAYLFDGHWLPLEKRKIKAKVKMAGFLKIPVSRTMYVSKYGPTFKTEDGFYAWRFAAGQTLKMAEQWLKMNKAQNFEEFHDALKMRGIVSTNIIYADREDNIFYISNGRIPLRNPNYNWREVLPGNTSATLWVDELVPIDSLPQVMNPQSGWVFNTNNTPFSSSAMNDNPVETNLNKVMGFQSTGNENNRSLRFLELMEDIDQLSYQDFKRLKFDDQYPQDMRFISGVNPNVLFDLNPEDYTDVKNEIIRIKEWDRRTNIENTDATLFLLTLYKMRSSRSEIIKNIDKSGDSGSRNKYVEEAIRMAKKELMEHFGSIEVPLGEWQRHSRGDVNLPVGGGPDVLTAMYGTPQKDGTYKAVAGESYISLVRFGEEGVEIESINAYGPSEYQEDANSTIQMSHFVNKKLRRISFDRQENLDNAVRIYHPQK